ncbi:MAG: DNA-binding protein [Candidatus Aenigmatarchaeota archaeon]
MKILLDTNFLLLPVQFKIDIFKLLKNYELFTLDLCVNEIKKLSERKTKDGIAAKVALELIKTKKINVIKSEKKKTDLAIIEIAKKYNYMVATNDKKLIKSLKRYGIKIIRLKQKKYLIEE